MTTGTLKIDPNSTGIYTVSVGTGGSGGTIGAVGGAGGSGYVKSRMVVDHEITGETITVSSYINHKDMEHSAISDKDVQDGIKQGLMKLLVEKLWKSNMIEFTRQEQVTEDATFFRARIHVVPDTQVRIIRELKDARKAT